MTWLIWVLGAVTLVWVLGFFAARIAERDPAQSLRAPEKEGAALDAVDVVVPARNEQENIGPLLESLLAQDHPPASIRVVDDRSEDGTAGAIDRVALRDPRVTKISGSGPEPGWTGKTAALTLGVEQAANPWVLFVDADVRLAPGNLRAALTEAQRRGWDGISLLGRWEMPSLAPRLLMCVIGGFVRGAHPIPKVNDASQPDAFLTGQYLLIRRAVFNELGGWGAVRSEVLEDVAFARRAKRRGVRIGVLRAPELMYLMPYRTVREVWNGYLKNFVAGAGGVGRSLLAAAAIFVFSVLPFLVVIPAALTGHIGLAIAASAACAAAITYRIGSSRMFHHAAWESVLHPIPNAIFVALIVTAAVRKSFGRPAQWKGREISL